MNYLIFDKDIYYETPDKKGMASRQEINGVFPGATKDFSVAVIDTLQKQLAAPEKSPSKKDEVIASSFTGDYLIQSEQVARNLFQVIAIEKTKVAEVYKHLGFENVRLVVPYGVALREFLKTNNLFDEKKRIVFLDHLDNQVLLTIFNNNLFTTPRRLSVILKQVVRELLRSQENYKALNKDEKEINFLIVTNHQEIIEEIVSSGLETKDNVRFVSEPYPALTGLKTGKFFMHFLLPEQFIRLRKLKIAKKRVFNLGVMAGVLAAFFILLLGSFSLNKTTLMRLKNLRFEQASQEEALKRAYQAKYKDILRGRKKIDLPYFVSSFISALPGEYKVESMNIRNASSGAYRFEAIVFWEAKDKPFVALFLPRAFRQARFENILVKGSPGIRVVLDIF